MAGRIRIHLPRHMIEDLSDGRPHFYNKLRDELRRGGADVSIVERALGNLPPAADDGDFHFVHQSAHRQANVLNTGLAYVMPFWYADPRGIYWESSIASAHFDPEAVPEAKAQAFFERTHRRLAQGRASRYDQPETAEDFPPGCIAVFLQGPSDLVTASRHMTTERMLATVLDHAGARQVVVKPHPASTDTAAEAVLRTLQAMHHNLIVTRANLHDILAAAEVTVSINSAVSLEGFLQQTPAILFGRSDFHHCCTTVTASREFPAALDAALTRTWPYARFLHWFLFQNMLNTGNETFTARVLARIAAQGVRLGDFGLPNV